MVSDELTSCGNTAVSPFYGSIVLVHSLFFFADEVETLNME